MARAQTRTGGRAETSGVIPGDYALSVGCPNKSAPEGWRWVKLTDVARLETGHTPSRKHPEYWGGDVPWIGIKDATSNHGGTVFETIQYTNDLGIANSSARILPAQTVCLSRTASVGYVVVMGVPMATSQDFVNWVCDESQLHYDFLKYVLLAEKSSFLRFSSGTTHQTIYFPEVKAFHICMPDLDTQKRISNILRQLDDKIELNRQINATLESMAQALFKSWFVDFDPVIDNALAAGNPIPEPLQARAEKRAALLAAASAADTRSASATNNANPTQTAPHTQPGTTAPATPLQPLPAGLRALFPDSFIFNEEMGWAPEGWAFVGFDKIADVEMGQSPKGDTYNSNGNGLPLVNGPVEFGDYFTEKKKWTTAPTKLSKRGDLIVCVRGSTTGRYVKSDGEYCLGRGVCSIRGKISQDFVDLVFKNSIDRLLRMTTGSTFPNWSGPTLKSFTALYPDKEVVSIFDMYARTWTEKIEGNVKQSLVLSNLRDFLLPKLLSGQIQLSQAEQLAAEAV